VKSGDRLDLIANETLKDPALWRKIAKENNIDNPLSFPKYSDIGKILIIPD
jgi:nucleoid-associated protein YgaU